MMFSFAGISCLQAMSYANLPFAENTVFPVFLEEHEDLYSKSVFLHVGSQSLRNKNPQGLLGGGFLEDVL